MSVWDPFIINGVQLVAPEDGTCPGYLYCTRT